MKRLFFPLLVLLLSLLILGCDIGGEDSDNLSSYFSHDTIALSDGVETIVLVPDGYNFDELLEPPTYIEFIFPSEIIDGTYELGTGLNLEMAYYRDSADNIYGQSGSLTVSDNLKRYTLEDVVMVDVDLNEIEVLNGFFSISEFYLMP